MKFIVLAPLLAAGTSLLLGACASGAAPKQAFDSSHRLTYSAGSPPSAPRTAAPERNVVTVLTKSSPEIAERGIVYFDFDKYDVKAQYIPELEKHAAALKQAGRQARIEGHADQFGSAEYNLALGNLRAEAVRKALTLLGVDGNRVETVSFGATKPVAEGEDAESRARNRRAIIRYAD